MGTTSKSEYTQLCTEILEAVGGSKNVKNVFHCITRLRIVPVNRDAVDMEKLSKVSGILKVVESSGQIQCVIGTTVPEVYEEFLAMSGVAAGGAVEAEPATDDVPEKKPNIITRGLNTLASCVTPGLYAIVAGGMIKGVVSLLTAIGLISSKSDIITVLNAVGDAPFYFMPFIIGYAAAKRFKVKEIFGIMTAGILMYSTFLSPKEGITGYAFGPINIPAYNYKFYLPGYSVGVDLLHHFPSHRQAYAQKSAHRLFRCAVLPDFCTAVPGFCRSSGQLDRQGYDRWLCMAVHPRRSVCRCAVLRHHSAYHYLWHQGWSAVELQNLEVLGHDYMLPNFFYSNLAVSGAVLAWALKQKPSEQRSAAVSTGLVCILGITEPALYGIALPEKKPLYAAMAGGAIAGASAMLMGVVTYAFSMPGITSIATYVDGGNNFFKLLIVMAIAWISSFVISFVMNKKEQ